MEEVSPTTEPKPNPNQTTFVQADPNSFKNVVQFLTGSPQTATNTVSNSNSNSNSGFKLYQRRNNQQLQLTPPPIPNFNSNSNSNSNTNSIFSPRNPEILSPSVLDFPSLALSPVTKLIPDPFGRSGSGQGWSTQEETEDKAIKEKGFYLHHSPREAEPPKLLPLFPTTSPGSSSSSDSC